VFDNGDFSRHFFTRMRALANCARGAANFRKTKSG
jgi:hypothetical protein